jgi:hypothetical protein
MGDSKNLRNMHTFHDVTDDMELQMVQDKPYSNILSLAWQDLGVSVRSRHGQGHKTILSNAFGIAYPGMCSSWRLAASTPLTYRRRDDGPDGPFGQRKDYIAQLIGPKTDWFCRRTCLDQWKAAVPVYSSSIECLRGAGG